MVDFESDADGVHQQQQENEGDSSSSYLADSWSDMSPNGSSKNTYSIEHMCEEPVSTLSFKITSKFCDVVNLSQTKIDTLFSIAIIST